MNRRRSCCRGSPAPSKADDDRKLERSDTGWGSVDISQYTNGPDEKRSPTPQPTITEYKRQKTTATDPTPSQQNPGVSSTLWHQHEISHGHYQHHRDTARRPHPCSMRARRGSDQVTARKLRLQAWDALQASQREEQHAESYEMVTLYSGTTHEQHGEVKDDRRLDMMTGNRCPPPPCAPYLHSTVVEVHASVTDLEEDEEELVENSRGSGDHSRQQSDLKKDLEKQRKLGDLPSECSDLSINIASYEDCKSADKTRNSKENDANETSGDRLSMLETTETSDSLSVTDLTDGGITSNEGALGPDGQVGNNEKSRVSDKRNIEPSKDGSVVTVDNFRHNEDNVQQEWVYVQKNSFQNVNPTNDRNDPNIKTATKESSMETAGYSNIEPIESAEEEGTQITASMSSPLQELSVSALPQITDTDILKMAQTFEKPLLNMPVIQSQLAPQTNLASSEDVYSDASSLSSPTAPLAPPHSLPTNRESIGSPHVSSTFLSPPTLPALQPAYPESPEIFDVSRRHRAYICLLRSKSYSDWSMLTQTEQNAADFPSYPIPAWNERSVTTPELEAPSTGQYFSHSTSAVESKAQETHAAESQPIQASQLSKTCTQGAITDTKKTPTRRRSYPLRNLGWDRARRVSRDESNAARERSRLELDLAQKVILRRKVIESLTPEEKLEHPAV
ncbi:hypothetical protein ElyMa_003335300 [Elysia marginata]|uniref:Uncharacterized protein n=1 Tax=Elysia marginata TaxID=1093978 RepID=A0AAV4JGW9_9GAST|nr:hypothetical protein ElyMa_003335300 [Elysia marginata]